MHTGGNSHSDIKSTLRAGYLFGTQLFCTKGAKKKSQRNFLRKYRQMCIDSIVLAEILYFQTEEKIFFYLKICAKYAIPQEDERK